MISDTQSQKPQRYRAYLLRVWQVESEGRPVWRASLEESGTGERLGFADLTLLAAYLSEQTRIDSQERAPNPDSPM